VIGSVAFLYASVGHAGATGYIAVMTLAGMAPAAIRPTALALNVIVAAIGTVQFARAGHFRGGLFLPLVLASAPCAALGGRLTLPTRGLEALLAAVLAVSAVRQVIGARPAVVPAAVPAVVPAAVPAVVPAAVPAVVPAAVPAVVPAAVPAVVPAAVPADEPAAWAAAPRATHLSWPALLALGAGVGLLSGLTGVGGGVFLTPALLALRVAPLKTIAAVTAPLILVNSLAGLVGRGTFGVGFGDVGREAVLAVAIGGLLGSQAGAFQLPVRSLRLLLAVVLSIASVKLLTSSIFPAAG
jgi:hypothetical protein